MHPAGTAGPACRATRTAFTLHAADGFRAITVSLNPKQTTPLTCSGYCVPPAEADEVRLRELCTELLGPARSSGAAAAPPDASAPEASLIAECSPQAGLPAENCSPVLPGGTQTLISGRGADMTCIVAKARSAAGAPASPAYRQLPNPEHPVSPEMDCPAPCEC